MTANEPLNFMPLDLDTFTGSERFMAGTRLGAAFSQGIRAYLRDKPKGKFGTHQYTPEDWGFTAAGLRADLKPYIDHFGVALEG